MSTETEARWKGEARRWMDYRRKRFWGLAALLVYVLAGFLAVPPILRAQVEQALGKSLDRPVTLERAGFNPLTLGVDLHGLTVTEKDKAPLLGFARLHVRLSPSSLWKWAWSFGDITLEGFKGDIVRYDQGDTNIGRLIADLSPKKDPTKPAKDEQGMRLIVSHFAIRGAEATFTDRAREPDFTTRIGPVSAEINHFSTLPDGSGQDHVLIDLEKGSTLELTGQLRLDPLDLSGHLKARGPYLPMLARYLGDALKIAVPGGMLDAELDYRVAERKEGDLGVALDHLRLEIADLSARAGEGASFLTLPRLRLANGHAAWPEREAGADSLAIEGLDLALSREQDGSIAPLATMLAQSPAPAEPSPAPPAQPGWAVSLGKLEVSKAKAHFEDKTLRQGGKIDIASLDVTLDKLSSKDGAPFPLSASATLAPGGTLKIEGTAALPPKLALDAKATISDVPAAVIQPYLHDFAKLAIEDGKLALEGDVKMPAPGALKIAGSGEIRSVKLKDEVDQGPVVAWDKLAIDRYVYRQDRNEVQISQVTLSSPFVRFQIAQDHSTNFSHILVPAGPPTPAGQPAPAGSGDPIKVGVGKINVLSGSADYGDATLPLPFATHITDLEGHIYGLSSSTASASNVSLKGQVDQYGQANIYGQVNPFHVGKGMKLKVAFRNVDFPGLSPYTAKFAGRRIAKGKLDVQSEYAIDQDRLTGSNKVVIREMELGEKVDVPGAMDLPLDLAISLLKDDEGKINLDLPVSGNIKDPQFELSGVIAKAVFDVIGDLVTAPFRALAGLFGGGDKPLDHIDFAPGRAEIEPPEREKIANVGEILKKRPKVGLVVGGALDPEADKGKLQRDALDAAMASALGSHDMIGRQRRYLEGLAEQKLAKDQLSALRQQAGGPADPDDPAYIAALRRAVAKTLPVDQAALDKLARARADAVAAAVKQVPGVDPARVSIGSNHQAKIEDGRIPLKLEAAAQD